MDRNSKDLPTFHPLRHAASLLVALVSCAVSSIDDAHAAPTCPATLRPAQCTADQLGAVSQCTDAMALASEHTNWRDDTSLCRYQALRTRTIHESNTTTTTWVYEDRILKDPDVPLQSSESYVVKLGTPMDHVCTGALISPNWVLTARHCTQDANGVLIPTSKHLIMQQDANEIAPSTTQGVITTAIHVHPDWDLALIYLRKPIVIDRYAKISNTNIESKVSATMTGYACRNEPTLGCYYGGSPKLVRASVKVWDDGKNCVHQGINYDGGGLCMSRKSIPGDSGGPVIRDKAIIGVLSWMYGDRDLLIEVYQHRDWISGITGGRHHNITYAR